MKKAIIILIGAMALFAQPQKIYATDYTLLETLIAAHKSWSNKLKERNTNDATKSAVETQNRDKSEDYSEIVKKVSKRMGDVYSYATFAAEMVHITALAKEVVELESEALELSLQCGLSYPRITKKAIELHDKFGIMTQEIVNKTVFVVSSGLGVSMATMEQRKEFTTYLNTRLSKMRRDISSFNFYAKAMKHLGKPGLFSWIKQTKNVYDAVDESAIANAIKKEINSVSKKTDKTE